MKPYTNRSRTVVQAQKDLAAGRPRSAYEVFLQLEHDGTGSLDVYIGLGKAALALDDAEQAEDWWKRATSKAPGNAECHFGLGTAQYHLGRLSEAIQSYRRALEIDPTTQGACVSLAIACLRADCPALALTYAEQALSREPDNVDMRLTRASVLIKLGRAAESIADLAWLHDQGAKLADVALLECEANRALGDFEAALVLAAKLAEAFPTLPAPLNCFRTIFADFVTTVPAKRVNEFFSSVGLPLYGIRIATRRDSRRSLRRFPTTDVVIPVHDRLDRLEACIRSLQSHGSPGLGEIILVNDCSSAKMRAWMRKVERSHPNIRVVHTRKRSGFTKALGIGLVHSHNSRFVALNSDCVVGEGWLERLSAAMPPQGRVAMVGPLSNNAGWQSLGEALDATGNYAGEPLPSVAEMERLQKRLDLLKVFDAPDIALIHGFCVLVDRQIYNDLGGLDAGLFPKGYGEFQDLSLRALDAGFNLRIADDSFVGHARGSSISALDRAELSREARSILYERHTALRYLAAECSATLNPQVSFTRRRLQVLDRYCPGAVTTLGRPAKATIHGGTDADLSGQRVCVFVSFAPDGRLLPYTLHYLSELKAQGFQTLLVLNEVGRHRLPPEALDLARIVMLRDNIGFDFGAWRDAVARIPSVWDAEIVLFTNDSIVGPFQGFDRLIDRIAESTAPLFFLTESEFAVPHFQSFFWGVKGGGRAHPVIRAFLSSVLDLADKTAAIFLYEVFFRHVCEKLGGIDSLCLFPLIEHTGVDSDIRPTFNPTHHLWRELLRAGFPFLKADFCRKNRTGPSAAAWQKEIALHGGDPMLARLHIEAMHLQRTLR